MYLENLPKNAYKPITLSIFPYVASNYSGTVLERGDQGLSESVVQYRIMCLQTIVSEQKTHQIRPYVIKPSLNGFFDQFNKCKPYTKVRKTVVKTYYLNKNKYNYIKFTVKK